MKRADSVPPERRDEDPTTFGEILKRLLELEPRANAAVLIDSEGETVDYASSLATFYTKVAAAYLRVVIDEIARAWHPIGGPTRNAVPGTAEGGLTQAIIRAQHRTFVVHPLVEGYALVLMLRRRAFNVSTRAVALTVCRLAKEARWAGTSEETLPWHPAEIETRRGDRFRPLQMKTGDAWERVEVLGAVVGPAHHREKGYRCRLQGGAEITLVRESTGVWFVDQPVRGLSSRLGPESHPPSPPSHSPNPRASRPPADG